jgi:hypothetical protein
VTQEDAPTSRISALLAEADAERQQFLAAVENVDPELETTPGIVGDWSARDLVAHVAWWCDHGADALELAASGRGDSFDYDGDETDAMNAAALPGWRALSMAEARAEEERAFERLRERVAGLDPALLDHRLGNGDSVEAVIRYDGPAHYAEHAVHVRAWFGDASEPDDGDDVEE